MKVLEKYWNSYFAQFVFISYWLLGLCNNFAYVIMLSAARDILSSAKNKTNIDSSISSSSFGNSSNGTNRYNCNDSSTGTILLADILPGICIKLIAPFFVEKIKYSYRVVVVIIVNASSFLLVALTPSDLQWLIFLGVCCASFSSSFGEISFLSMSTLYSRTLSISGWSSGTGAAGLLGSFGYAALTSIGVKPRDAILIMLFIPVLMALSYIMLPSIEFAKNRETIKEEYSDLVDDTDVPDFTSTVVNNRLDNERNSIFGKFLYKLSLIRPLLKYMIPLFLVYFAEYFINQGLFELLYFKNSFEHEVQYRWYNVVYQAAVFVSRSSIKCVKITKLWIFPIMQFGVLAFLLSEVMLQFLPSIWIVFGVIFFEGLFGGGCYVNAFDLVSIEVPKELREFSIAVTSVADSLGITLAGFTSIPVHNAICDYGKKISR